MKCGSLAAKELTDFFRESAKLEEENAKTHAKLAKQVGVAMSVIFLFNGRNQFWVAKIITKIIYVV